jgi:hypothetical protein
MSIPNHTRIYMAHFGYQIPEDVRCEITGQRANDIHHIRGRGKGKDVIENLMALTREKHDDCHAERIKKAEAQEIHDRFLAQHAAKKNRSK